MKKVIAYYGTILLQLKEETSEKLTILYQEGERKTEGFYGPYYEEVLSLQQKIYDVLKETPNVENLRWDGKLCKEHFEPFENHLDLDADYLMEFSCPIIFDVKMPITKRKYQMPGNIKEGLAEKYSVIYNGNTFLAYTLTDDELMENLETGAEIRENLTSILGSENWHPVIMPPCPLRMNFCVQSFEEANSEEISSKEFGVIYDDTTFDDIDEVDDIMLRLFYSNQSNVTGFCSLMSLKHKIEQTTWKINEGYENLVEKFNQKNKTKYSKKNDERLRERIFNLHNDLFEYDQLFFQYIESKDRFIKFLNSDNFVSAYLRDYFITEVQIKEYNQKNILNSIAYMEERLRENRSITSSISAALVGGLAGLITSGIILLLELLLKMG